MSDNFAGWHEDQIRSLRHHLLDFLAEDTIVEVTAIETKGENLWRVFYAYERVDGREIRTNDYITGRLVHSGFEDFWIA